MGESDDRWDIRCDWCGQFISHEQMIAEDGASNCFIPDSHYSREEDVWRCRDCTYKHGPAQPHQSVFGGPHD